MGPFKLLGCIFLMIFHQDFFVFLGEKNCFPTWNPNFPPIFEGQPRAKPSKQGLFTRIKRRVMNGFQVYIIALWHIEHPHNTLQKSGQKSLESKLLAGSRYWHRQTLGRRGLLLPIHPVILGCPRKLGSMARINGLFHLLINGIHWGYNPLILTIDPFTSNGTSSHTSGFHGVCFFGMFWGAHRIGTRCIFVEKTSFLVVFFVCFFP